MRSVTTWSGARTFRVLIVVVALASAGMWNPLQRPGDADEAVAVAAAPAQAGALMFPSTAVSDLDLSAPALAYRPPPGSIAGFPAVYGVDYVDAEGITAKRVFLGFSAQEDYVGATDDHFGVLTSGDGGLTFPTASLQRDVVRGMNIARRGDGQIIDVRFDASGVVDWHPDNPVNRRRYVTVRADASPTGERGSWRPLNAQCPATDDANADGITPVADKGVCLKLNESLVPGTGVRFHGGIVNVGANRLLMPYYASFDGDPVGSKRVELAESTDGGLTWETKGVIARPTRVKGTKNVWGYTEASTMQLRNGWLYTIVRRDVRDSDGWRVHGQDAFGTLVYAVSKDGGRTWSNLRELKVARASGKERPWQAVAPVGILMPNGVYVLVGGRPDNFVAIADSARSDGTPQWRAKTLVHRNFPRKGNTTRFRGSSGYMAVTPVASDRALIVVDNCAPRWGCPEDSRGWHDSSEYKLMQVFMDLAVRGSKKIDLASGLRAGKMRLVDNDFVFRPSGNHPETRWQGAFDGSTSYWSSAMARGDRPAAMTVDLGRRHTLSKIGLSLHRDTAATARVYLSSDGTDYRLATLQGDPEDESVTLASRSVEYFELSTPADARFVRVVVDPTADCPPEFGGAACVSLNELELYTPDAVDADVVERGRPGAPRGPGS